MADDGGLCDSIDGRARGMETAHEWARAAVRAMRARLTRRAGEELLVEAMRLTQAADRLLGRRQ
jgi:hypothetical protein